jgi:omega-amidase
MVVTVAGCQLAFRVGAGEQNVERMEESARAAKGAHPDLCLLAFPELALSGYRLDAGVPDVAEPWPNGASFGRLSALARELELVIVAGFPELDPSTGQVFDSTAIFDADGAPVGAYRKAHCLEKERSIFSQGNDLPVWRTRAGKFGVLVCWDAAMPEAARVIALQAPDFVVVVAAWEDPYLPDWKLVIRARAFDNVLPILACNATGGGEDRSFSGGSCLVDCLGQTVAECGSEEDSLVVGTIDTERTHRVRCGYGSQLRDRRPELYSAVSDESAAFLNESRGWVSR